MKKLYPISTLLAVIFKGSHAFIELTTSINAICVNVLCGKLPETCNFVNCIGMIRNGSCSMNKIKNLLIDIFEIQILNVSKSQQINTNQITNQLEATVETQVDLASKCLQCDSI